jgi:hypothetical protein
MYVQRNIERLSRNNRFRKKKKHYIF